MVKRNAPKTTNRCTSESAPHLTDVHATEINRSGHSYINKRCMYGIPGREITKYTVIYDVHIRFWPTLQLDDPSGLAWFKCMPHHTTPTRCSTRTMRRSACHRRLTNRTQVRVSAARHRRLTNRMQVRVSAARHRRLTNCMQVRASNARHRRLTNRMQVRVSAARHRRLTNHMQVRVSAARHRRLTNRMQVRVSNARHRRLTNRTQVRVMGTLQSTLIWFKNAQLYVKGLPAA